MIATIALLAATTGGLSFSLLKKEPTKRRKKQR
jgi:hypothetical protein